MKKLFSLLCIIALLVFALSGCGCNQQPAQEADKEPEAPAVNEQPPEKTAEKVKVVLLLPGPVNDMGWNAFAYDGLKEAEEKFDVEVAFSENIQQSDMEEVLRGYAMQDYDIIIGHGFQFNDSAKKVAAEFPDSRFVVTSSDVFQAPNLTSVNIDNEQQGFLAGVAAAMLTKTNVVGSIGGQDMPPIRGVLVGFEKGVKYINPDLEILSAMTGSFDDVAKTKETALVMISKKADIIVAAANQAGLGSIEACQEKGILAIGINQDQNSIAPDTVVTSSMKNGSALITFVVEKFLKGELEPEFYNLGIGEKAVHLAPWHGFDDKVPQEVKDKLQEVSAKISSGEIKVN